MNFIQKCLAGNVLQNEIDDFVDQWHKGEAGQGQELHEFLGMTWDEYSFWAVKPSVLPFILAAHINSTSLEAELTQQQYAMPDKP